MWSVWANAVKHAWVSVCVHVVAYASDLAVCVTASLFGVPIGSVWVDAKEVVNLIFSVFVASALETARPTAPG